MAEAPRDILISRLTGGMNDSDLPANLADDQCALALNVEFFLSSLGERRLGMAPISLTDSGLTTAAFICLLAERFPDNNIENPERWAFSATVGGAVKIAYLQADTWHAVTPAPSDTITTTEPDVYRYQAQALDAKLFFAYPSNQDRLHVWDGTTLRRTGLIQPAVPTVADV